MPAAEARMLPGSRVVVLRKPRARSSVTNHASLLPGVTDARSTIARRFRDVVTLVIDDQGGLARISEARLQLIRRFAATAVMAEALEGRLANGEAIDVGEHALLSSTLVRLGQRIGLGRHAAKLVPNLGDYLEQRAAKTVKPDETVKPDNEFDAR